MIKHRVTSTASIPPVIFQQSCDLATRSLARKRARLRAESDREAFSLSLSLSLSLAEFSLPASSSCSREALVALRETQLRSPRRIRNEKKGGGRGEEKRKKTENHRTPLSIGGSARTCERASADGRNARTNRPMDDGHHTWSSFASLSLGRASRA